MKDLTKIYLDLSKCTEEDIKSLPLILGNESIYFDDKRLFKKGKYNLDYPLFYFSFSNQWIGGDKTTNQKRSELTYPEFIKLFEGGEGENNGWIKIESKSQYDLLENGEYHWYNINTGRYDKGDLWEFGTFTHYQPIIKPLPPLH